MNDPLAVECINFTNGTGKKKVAVKRPGDEIIRVCHEVFNELVSGNNKWDVRLVKTYRSGEKFTPCLAIIGKDGSIDDFNPYTVYIRPTLRDYNQGFNPEKEYEKLYVASGLVTATAYFNDPQTYDTVETSVMVVRKVRRALTSRLGGKNLLDRRPKCVLCGQWVAKPEGDTDRFNCPTHGDNPPIWLAKDNAPPPNSPPAGSPALLPDGGPKPQVGTASRVLVA